MSTFDPKTILELDGYLEPFLPAITRRHERFQEWKNAINDHEGGYDKFSRGYDQMGFTVRENGEFVYREWAPGAKEANLIGEFSMLVYPHPLRPGAENDCG